MRYSIAKKSVSCREIKKIKNTREKAPKKSREDISNSSRDEYNSNPSLSRDSDWDEYRRPYC